MVTFEERVPMLAAGPLVHQGFDPSRIEETLKGLGNY